ncbi:hypothetical protein Tco_1083322 [Tanacetum coccineum]
MHSAVLYQSGEGPRVIMSEYQVIKRCEQVKRLKESLSEAPLEVSETLKIGSEIFVTEHKLTEDKKITPVQQKRRGMAPERSAATSKEVEELEKARILKETRYQTWVANIVMVKKIKGAWRMCVDFTNINKACPKDCYSLPVID